MHTKPPKKATPVPSALSHPKPEDRKWSLRATTPESDEKPESVKRQIAQRFFEETLPSAAPYVRVNIIS